MSLLFQDQIYTIFFEIFGESVQHEARHKYFTNHPFLIESHMHGANFPNQKFNKKSTLQNVHDE